ncbi:DUF2726 domain-containing protein [Sphingomonas sp. DT-207]|uniref:DUF2726 domain-containing protein n=1 Tax=Sphingomonas sp. DT-207 TaxID=3396167 RepID=UPI003F19E4E6
MLLLILAVGAVIGISVERLVEGQHSAERRAYWRGRNANKGRLAPNRSGSPRAVPERATLDAAEQLRRVMDAHFKPRALLNKPERRLLACIDKVLAEESPGWRAMGQVSLGEILWSDDKDAFWAINAKRVDLLIVDAECRPLHAIEFQGSGHHLGAETAARDAVKKEALRRAGIGYVEVVTGNTPAEVREMVRKLTARAAVAKSAAA